MSSGGDLVRGVCPGKPDAQGSDRFLHQLGNPAGAAAHERAVSVVLERVEAGDAAARGELLEVAYEELRRMAGGMMRRERANHTLQPTALVNEAWIRLAAERGMEWHDRGHFFAVAAQLMRFILVDYARRRAPPRESERRAARILADSSSVGVTPRSMIDSRPRLMPVRTSS